MSTPVKVIVIVVLAAAVVGAGFLGAQVAAMQRAAFVAAPRAGAALTPAPSVPGQAGPKWVAPAAPRGRQGLRAPSMPGRRGNARDFRRGGAASPLRAWPAQYRTQVHAATAEALGISVDDLDKALAAGKGPWQIAQEKNISASDFQKKLADALSKTLKQAVADGDLTQAQADAIVAQVRRGVLPGMMGRGWGRGMYRDARPGGRGRR